MAEIDRFDKQSKESLTVFGKNNSRPQQLDTICNAYIGVNQHLEMLSKYPVLQLAYNQDGSKKDIITLLQDRVKKLENGENPEIINELYKTIANQKNFYIGGLTGVKPEILALGKYIQETGTDDEFVYDLLRDRLQMKNLTPENIENLIQQQKKSAEIRRMKLKYEQEINQQEIEYEKPESIKDEVGDEFVEESEQQQQDNQPMQELNDDALLESAIEATEENVSIENINRQAQQIKKIQKEKEQIQNIQQDIQR